MKQNLILLLVSVSFTFACAEFACRVIDPYPYFSASEIAQTRNGDLTCYDSLLGWRGVPNSQVKFVTVNARIWIQQNSHGNRDIEHVPSSRPALVFLGDSFTWGFEVRNDEMFVSRLRSELPEYEIFNLSHRGYGTDQSLLTWRQWLSHDSVAWVILVFSENDVVDNNSRFRYEKSKPYFMLNGGSAELNGIPVPRSIEPDTLAQSGGTDAAWKTRLKGILFLSHVLHEVQFRYWLLKQGGYNPPDASDVRTVPSDATTDGLPAAPGYEHFVSHGPAVTGRLLAMLRDEVAQRGGRLAVVFVPSKTEIETDSPEAPYQAEITDSCVALGIPSLDLAPEFKSTWQRLYFRHGMHWNARGHALASQAIGRYLRALESNPEVALNESVPSDGGRP